MVSLVGQSGSRPVNSPSNAAVQGRAPPAPVQNAVPATAPATHWWSDNSHFSDYSQTDRLRTQIDAQSRNNPSPYGTLVGAVNGWLQSGGYGISPASQQSVMENLRDVSQGTIPQSTAHFREARTFALDALMSYTHGRFFQGGMELWGATINLSGGIGMSALEGAQRVIGPRSLPSNGGTLGSGGLSSFGFNNYGQNGALGGGGFDGNGIGTIGGSGLGPGGFGSFGAGPIGGGSFGE